MKLSKHLLKKVVAVQFDSKMVHTYLRLVHDKNPLHSHIVPGQLVCEYIFQNYQLTWSSFKIKYQRPIQINEKLYIQKEQQSVKVFNQQHELKLIIYNRL